MLMKLLKYDLKNMYKFLVVFYILSIFFALTTRLFFSIDDTTIIKIIGQISVGCMFAMIANIFINNIMRCFVRFRDTLYKDESYLTHTLPIKKSEIYNSKFILSFITLLSSFLVILLTLFIAYFSEEKILWLKNMINSFITNADISVTMFIISIIVILFLELFSGIQSGYIGIILGYKKNNKKIGFSILYGFIYYILTQLFVLLVIRIIAIFNSDIMSLFTSNNIDMNLLKLLIILSIVIYVVIIIVSNLIAQKIFKKGVNVE